MWLQFFGQNMHFAIYMFAALVCMAVSWLYLDAWRNKHDLKELLKWSGFAAIGASFVIQALIVENSISGKTLLGDAADTFAMIIRLAGLGAIVAGQIIDPLQAVPKLTGLGLTEASKDSQTKTNPKSNAWYVPISISSHFLLPIAGFFVAMQYYRRATTGLERHLKVVAYAFVGIGLADALRLLSFYRNTDNPVLYDFVRAFGVVWVFQHIALLVGAILLGKWVWGYLTKRFFSQLLMFFVLTIGSVFLIISIGFTALLLRDIRSNALTNLEVSTHVLNYAFVSKQSEATAVAEQIAGAADIISAVTSKDHDALVKITKDYLVAKKQSDLIITDSSGQVLLRASDTDRWGDSVSSDPLVKRALLGVAKSGVVVNEGINAPTLQVGSVAVIRQADGTIVGSATTKLNLDMAFIGGIKRSTSLDSSLYANDILIATTRQGAEGKTTDLGTKLTNKTITNRVLKDGKVYSGRLDFANQEYVAAFVPIKDPDGIPVAILSVDKPESALLETASRSIELTFILTSAILLLSIVPVSLITRHLVKQVS